MLIFSDITEKGCIKDRYPHLKARISLVLYDNLEMIGCLSVLFNNSKWNIQHCMAIAATLSACKM